MFVLKPEVYGFPGVASLPPRPRAEIDVRPTPEVVTLSEAEMPRLRRREGGPIDLVLVRHGESEGNLAKKLFDEFKISEKVFKQIRSHPNNQLRLTPNGEAQAKAAGEWLAKNLGFVPDYAFTSHFVRAQETAGLIGGSLQLSRKWYSDSYFGERWWGKFDELNEKERKKAYKERETNPRYWTPPGGESLRFLELCSRTALGSLARKYPDDRVLIVTHGELITAMCMALQRFSDDHLREAMVEGVPNCGIAHFSRKNPKNGEVEPYYRWMRLACPWDLNWKSGKWNGEWQEITRPSWTSEELLTTVRRYPRFIEQGA